MKPFDFNNQETWTTDELRFYCYSLTNVVGKTKEELEELDKNYEESKSKCRQEFLGCLLAGMNSTPIFNF